MSEQQIVYIELSKLHPHPSNPRKKLGDLTELTESIKSNGVLQNLTVVSKPDGPEGHYYTVIGHRRCAGAKKAGLQQVPCVISDMNNVEQVRTMMVENMQRSDLSVYEQAQGFQMMLDMGDSVDDISKSTGFSDSTVRHRIKLLDLDSDKLRKSASRGASLKDYAKLEQIKDPERRNRVLDSIGTANFNSELKQARDQEKEEENRTAAIQQMERFAKQISSSETEELRCIKAYYYDGKAIEKPDDTEETELFYNVSPYCIRLFRKPTTEEMEENDADAKERQKQKETGKQLEKIAKRAFELRYDFVKNLSITKTKITIICEMNIRALCERGSFGFDQNIFCKLIELKKGRYDRLKFEMVSDTVKTNPERAMLLATYANFGDGIQQHYHNWMNLHSTNSSLDALYEYLKRLGYEMSDEEIAYQNGSHNLFAINEVAPSADSTT